MSEKLNIEQLVSSKLANAEIAPSQASWQGIQRKLRWKQFMRFRPRQFNIYYLAGLIIAAAGLAFVLLTNPTGPAIEEAVLSTPENTILEENFEDNSSTSQGDQKEQATQQKSTPSNSDIKSIEEKAAEDIDNPESSQTVESSNKEDENPVEETKDNNLATAIVPAEAVEPIVPEEVIELQTPPTVVSRFVSSVQAGCVPLEVQFINQSIHAVSSQWSFGKNGQSIQNDPVFVFEEAGNYTVSLKVEDQNGQSAIYQETIEVYEKPVADFIVEEGFEGVDGHLSLSLLNYSSDANQFSWNLLDKDNSIVTHWSSDEFQPSLKLTDIKNGTSQISLIATSENGCSDTAIESLPVLVQSSDVKIKFATAFSPNPTGPGDGTYSPGEKRIDLFHPIFLEVPVDYHLVVYTKRGEMVFETRDPYKGWDGYFHEERSAGGVYVWMLEGTWLNGESFKKQGDVTLIWQDIW